MASQEQLLKLSDLVLEALKYRQKFGDNQNPSLGRAILYADELLLSWTRRRIESEFDDTPPDAENLVADAGVKAILGFGGFRGLTGAEFLQWLESIVAQLIAQQHRLRNARRNGGVRQVRSLEGDAEAAQLAQLLESHELSPDANAAIRENAARVRRVFRALSFDQRRVVRLRMAGFSLREIATTFEHSPSWVQDTWEAAAHELRRRLMRPCRTKQPL